MIDIVKPSGNEKEIIEMALRLGLKEIVLYYEKIPSKKLEVKGLQIYYASHTAGDIIISQNKGEKKRRQQRRMHGKRKRRQDLNW